MHEQRNSLGLVMAVMAGMVLSGCNAFTQNYRGERFERVAIVRLVDHVPEDTTKIGEARVRTCHELTIGDAVEAAEAIGAHYVMMSRFDLGERGVPVGTSMMVSGGLLGSPIAVNVPVLVTRRWYEYVADFYRSEDNGTHR